MPFIKFSRFNVASHRGTRPVPPCSPSGIATYSGENSFSPEYVP